MKILAAVVFGTGGALTICCAAALWGSVGIGLGVGLFLMSCSIVMVLDR